MEMEMEMETEMEMKMLTLHSHSQWSSKLHSPLNFVTVLYKKKTVRELQTAVTENGALQSSDMHKKAALIKAHYYSLEY